MSLVDLSIVRSEADDARDYNDPNCSAFDALDAEYDPFSDPHHQARYDAHFDAYDASGFPKHPRPNAVTREQHEECSNFHIEDDVWSLSSSSDDERGDQRDNSEAGPSTGGAGSRQRKRKTCALRPATWPARPPSPDYAKFEAIVSSVTKDKGLELPTFPAYPTLLSAPGLPPTPDGYPPVPRGPSTFYTPQGALVAPPGASLSAGGPLTPQGGVLVAHNDAMFAHPTLPTPILPRYDPANPPPNAPRPPHAPRKGRISRRAQGPFVQVYTPNAPPPRAGPPIQGPEPPPPPPPLPPPPPPDASRVVHLPADMDVIARIYGLVGQQLTVLRMEIEVFCMCPPLEMKGTRPRHAGDPDEWESKMDWDKWKEPGRKPDKIEGSEAQGAAGSSREGSGTREGSVAPKIERCDSQSAATSTPPSRPIPHEMPVSDILTEEGLYTFTEDGDDHANESQQASSLRNGLQPTPGPSSTSNSPRPEPPLDPAFSSPRPMTEDPGPSSRLSTTSAIPDPSTRTESPRHSVEPVRPPTSPSVSHLPSMHSQNGNPSTSSLHYPSVPPLDRAYPQHIPPFPSRHYRDKDHYIPPPSLPSLPRELMPPEHYGHVNPRDTISHGSWMDPPDNGDVDMSPPPSPVIRSGALPSDSDPGRATIALSPNALQRPLVAPQPRTTQTTLPPFSSLPRPAPTPEPPNVLPSISSFTQPAPSPAPASSGPPPQQPRPTDPQASTPSENTAQLTMKSMMGRFAVLDKAKKKDARSPTPRKNARRRRNVDIAHASASSQSGHPQPGSEPGPSQPQPQPYGPYYRRDYSIPTTPEEYGGWLAPMKMGSGLVAPDSQAMVRWRLPKPGQNGQAGHGQGADQAVEVRELKEGQTPLLSLEQRSIRPPQGDGQQEAWPREEQRPADERGEEKHRRSEDHQQHDGAHSPPASKGKRTLCGFKSSASAEPQSARPDPDYEPDAAELFDHVQLHAWASHGMRCPWRGCEYYFRGKSNGYSNLRKHLLTHWKTRSNTICPLCYEGITVNGPMALPRHYASGWCNALQQIAVARNLPVPARAGNFGQDGVISAPVVR